MSAHRPSLTIRLRDLLLSVPVRIKLAGIVMLPVLILGLSLNYWVRTGLSDWLTYLLAEERIEVAMQVGSRSVIFVTILAALASILFASTLTFLFTRPILELRKVALQVAGGKLDSRARIRARDEVGEVAIAFNAMLDRLVEKRDELQRANQRLAAMNRVAMAAARGVRIADVLDNILSNILDVMGLQSGWVFLRNPETGAFQLVTAAGLDPDFQRRLSQGNGSQPCFCQRDLMRDQLGKKAVVREQCTYAEGAGPDHAHNRCGRHMTIPLEARDMKFGMINLCCPGAFCPTEEDVELLTAIGAQVSEIVATAWFHAQLVEKEAARRVLLESLVKAQEDEQFRLARELHDGAGQSLTSILVHLKMLEKQAGAEQMRDNLGRVQEEVADSIEEIRELSHRLRPAALEELGLPHAIEALAQDMAREGNLAVDVHCDLGDKTLTLETEKMLYRIAQESLTNVVRHAHASHVEVELVTIPYAVCLRVEDDGRGFDPDNIPAGDKQRPLGLVSMEERAQMLGGSLVVETAPGRGASIQVRVPLDAEGI